MICHCYLGGGGWIQIFADEGHSDAMEPQHLNFPFRRPSASEWEQDILQTQGMTICFFEDKGAVVDFIFNRFLSMWFTYFLY